MNGLHSLLLRTQLLSHPHHSRVHRLSTFGNASLACYVKRDDELGFGISGCKLRKYLSLLPKILEKKPQEAVVIGSAYSGHVLSIAQLLIEHGVAPFLFLLGDPRSPLLGNFMLSSLFVPKERIRFFPRAQWENSDSLAEEFAKTRARCVVIPKGANCKEAIAGGLTLAIDILQNEKECGQCFDHLFIDAGTGMTAATLILAFAYWKRKSFIHVVQMAGTPREFNLLLAERKSQLEELLGEPIPSPHDYQLYCPKEASAFGSINPPLFQDIAAIAREEGFLTDPVFTAKLFREGREIIRHKKLTGTALFIHSGGGLGLMGFQKELQKQLQDWPI